MWICIDLRLSFSISISNFLLTLKMIYANRRHPYWRAESRMSGRFNILFMFCGLEIYISLIRICIYLNLKCCPLEKPLFNINIIYYLILFNIQSPALSLMRPFFGTSGCWVREMRSVLLLSCKKPLGFFNEYLIYSSTSRDISEKYYQVLYIHV